MNIKKTLLALGMTAVTLGMASCAEKFDPVNPVIYLEAGAEKGSGTEAKPYGDILDAIAKAKELGVAGAEHITLKFGAGDYSLTETLTLSSEAFGGASLEMICEDEDKAVVGAWLPVTDFTETEVNGVKAWVADMPQLNGETVYSHQFFNGDYERLERPRYPEECELRVEFITGADREKIDATGKGHDNGVKDAFYFFEGDIPENLTRLSDIQMCLYHYWNDERLTVKSINYDTNLIEFEAQTYWLNFGESDGGGRYYLDNVYEYLNESGEVYNDRESGKLYYIPYADDDIESFKIYASTIDTMLIIDGMNGSKDQNSLIVRNIGFEGSDWKDVNRYVIQAAQDITASIRILNSNYILFENCSFNHIGNHAVEIKTYVNNVTFDRCSVSDLGGGGFRISGANIVPVTEEVPHDITITDCTINGYGRVHKSSVGVFIQFAHDCTISHNEISDGYYSGMSIGWIWGYADHATSNILIEKNYIHNIGQGILSDMGGIYLLGKQPGTVLRENLIHDIKTYEKGYGGWAYYTDEGSSDILIEKNIGYNCSDTVYHHHYGANNIVRNNIFAFGKFGCVRSSKEEDHVSFTLERNILINDFGPIYYYDEDKESFVDDSNLMWDYTLDGAVISRDDTFERMSEQGLNYAKETNFNRLVKKGFYNNAVVADPLFADPFNGDFTLAENSPAWDIGFEPIDISDVGPRN
ncbi:MAG: right-handed parallel beta-helix repeat-containing protein [Ruminococcaceae bacterium]|nr:right-handed parallel beta-helix repeat-containing protein [Oscillospiraceae bacterium]